MSAEELLSVQKEINFILEREELTHALYDLQQEGKASASCNTQ